MYTYKQTRQLSKNPLDKKVSGICSGLARYWNQPTWLVRVAALMLLLVFPVPMAMAYLLGAILLPNRYSA